MRKKYQIVLLWAIFISVFNSEGVSQDFTETVKWIQKAADQENAEAIEALNILENR